MIFIKIKLYSHLKLKVQSAIHALVYKPETLHELFIIQFIFFYIIF